MAIFLDYYIPEPEEGISNIAILEGRITKYFRGKNLANAISLLAGRELIVVFGKPIGNIIKAAQGYEHIIEDQAMRKRWYDLHSKLRKASELSISLSKIARSTLGEDAYAEMTRLEPAETRRYRSDIENKLDGNLRVLQAVYEYALKFDQVSYTRGTETRWTQININENIVIED